MKYQNQSQSKPKLFIYEIQDEILKVLMAVRIHPVASIALIAIRTIIFLFAATVFDQFNMSDAQKHILKMISVIYPLNLTLSNSDTMTYTTLLGSFLVNFSFYMFFFIPAKFKNKQLRCVFGIWTYFYLYVGVHYVISILILHFKTEKQQEAYLVTIFTVINLALILFTVITYVFGVFLFANYSLRNKDSLAQELFLSMFMEKFMFLFVIPFTFFLKKSFPTLAGFISMIFVLNLLYNYYQKVHYTNHSVSIGYLIIVCFSLYFFIIFLISNLSEIEFISNNFYVLIVVGFCFIGFDLFLFRDAIFNYFVFLDISKVKNVAYFNKHIRLIVQLIQSAKKGSQSAEFLMLSVMTNHTKHCRSCHCLCRSRSECHDPKTNQFSSESIPVWKDFIFIRNVIYSVILDFSRRIPIYERKEVDLLLIFYLFEIMGNSVTSDFMTKQLKTIQKDDFFRFIYSINLQKVDIKNREIALNSLNGCEYASNNFEFVIDYERTVDELKYSY